jgi:NAD(P)H-hydrate epimerase
MLLPTGTQMQAVDREAIEVMGIPSLDLMERAGAGVAAAARVYAEDARGPVVVACGRGNNGGDGLVAARLLAREGIDVQVWLAAEPEQFTGDAGANWDRMLAEAENLPGTIQVLPVGEDEVDTASIAEEWRGASAIVDALLGTGVTGAPRPPLDSWITAMNVAGPPIVAVDIPSGVNAENGAVEGVAPLASVTVTMALPKRGLLLYPGREHTGCIQVVDIGIPPEAAANQEIGAEVLTHAWAMLTLPSRTLESHKGDYGRVVVIAGSAGMMGAGRLVSAAAYRAGAGLVRHAAPASLLAIAHSGYDEVMVAPLEDGGAGHFVPLSDNALLEVYEWADAIALGPGLGTAEGTANFLGQALSSEDPQLPMVIDADALNLLAEDPAQREGWAGPVVLTPHPGEAARLLETSNDDVVSDRFETARELARRYDAVIVLKGAPTVISAAEGRIALCPVGNPGMASGGTGDVLTGIITALLGQGLPALDASALAVYLHAFSADLAAMDLGVRSLMAQDLIRYLPAAFNHIATYPDHDVLAQEVLR